MPCPTEVEVELRKNLEKFLKYVEFQWIKKTSPKRISVYNIIHQTNNPMEGLHSKMGKSVGGSHQFFLFYAKLYDHIIYQAIDTACKVEAGTYVYEEKKKKLQKRRRYVHSPD